MKLRLRFAKRGKVRFTGHRDVARIWERALRKAGLPVALTEGFSPRPRVSFGLALPTGAESDAEYLDVVVAPGVEVELLGLAERLTEALPPGFGVLAVEVCAPGTPSLQEAVVASGWDIELDASLEDVAAGVEQVLAATSVPLVRERKGERTEDDVRGSIEALSCADHDGHTVLRAVLATKGRNLRPHELAAVVLRGRDPLDTVVRVLRTHQWIEASDGRHELMPVAEAPVSA